MSESIKFKTSIKIANKHFLLDEKCTILSSTMDLLDKNNYLCGLIRLRNEKYNPQSKG